MDNIIQGYVKNYDLLREDCKTEYWGESSETVVENVEKLEKL